MSEDSDDLLKLCGVTLPTGKEKKPPKPKPVPVEFNHQAPRFEFGGYVARIWRYTCISCETETDVLEGVFSEEIDVRSGARRLLSMVKGTQFPQEDLRREVVERPVDVCGWCIGRK